MKKNINLFCAAALMSALCAGFVACNEPKETDPWLGKEIPGIETHHATGTVIGSYGNGFASLLVQVDEEFPIGKPVEVASSFNPSDPDLYTYQPYPCSTLKNDTHSSLTYHNLIQVQYKLPVKIGNRISFSGREIQDITITGKDRDLFIIGDGLANAFCIKPNVPIYVITKYEIITVKD